MSDTKDIKIFDVEEVFELNPDMKIEMMYLGENKLPLIIIDDFYKNPQRVREVLIQAPVPNFTSSAYGGYPGKRISLGKFIPEQFQHEYSELLKKQFQLNFDLAIQDSTFLGNVFDGAGAASKVNNSTPHSDPSAIASIVYLNLDDEEVGGTSVYRHRESGLDFFPFSPFHFEWWVARKASIENRRISRVKEEEQKRFDDYKSKIFSSKDDSKEKRDTHILESNDEWEIMATVESKFNRLAGYIGGTLHSAMIDFEELSKKPYRRINQVMFMDMKRNPHRR